jgi:hypothetical protein
MGEKVLLVLVIAGPVLGLLFLAATIWVLS